MPVQRGITLSAALVVTGCLATPRAQDAPAPREYASQLQHDEPECARNVMVFDPGTIPQRRYHEIASLSATCYPGALANCERRLKARACELGADAIILGDTTRDAPPPGASPQSLVSRSARAVRWTDGNELH